ncbi:MAG TPA: hypothetical protein VF824_03085 [Thermoanaerobaculia bacterium]|jgi:vacuolar-type H+-ATPase subunit I/STV1
MNTLLLVVVLALATGDTSTLVNASKATKAKRKTSTTRVITNADVKKSKGKLVEQKPTAPADAPPSQTLTEKYEAERAQRAASEARLASAQALVNDLERELARIEQSYYDENDLDRRDREIVKRFNDTKAKLDAARKELDAAKPQ